jgi:hypothetical protein
MTFGKYTIDDTWLTKHSNATYKKITSSESTVWDFDTIQIYKVSKFGVEAYNLYISLQQIRDYYIEIYGSQFCFDTSELAMERADFFINKINKLKVFL